MTKRARDGEKDFERSPEAGRCTKRARATAAACSRRDRLSMLSDEVLLRILSFLSIIDLNKCQRLSRKFKSIAADSQLWKALYYNRFVRPRVLRLPGMRGSAMIANPHGPAPSSEPDEFGRSSSKPSRWLDDHSLVKQGSETDWKRQYKLRHNWTHGVCAVDEILVAEQLPPPPLIARMHNSIVYTVDAVGGLRAWSSAKNQRGMLAKTDLPPTGSPPTALAVDTTSPDGSLLDNVDDLHQIAVGFEDGSFAIFIFDRRNCSLTCKYKHSASSNGMLSTVALCSPYLVTLTAAQLLSLYKFEGANGEPRLLHSLRSHTTWSPLSLSIRPSSQNIIATIAYAIPTFVSGWTVGVQEMWLSLEGILLDSRLATSISPSARSSASLPASLSPSRTGSPCPSPSFSAATPGYSKPTSLSYSHPYLLLSHPDNTLTLYLVTSTDRSLSISAGHRLWGHTSSVSGAYVGGRGKAVSVTTRGDELRIWELEGTTGRRRPTNSELSVRVQAPSFSLSSSMRTNVEGSINVNPRCDTGPQSVSQGTDEMGEMNVARGWIGFDEENVVLLKERGVERVQALAVYDFT
ncbi:uncharacterized protein PV09_09203 [Verruconis gallopava]|uniref:F-box domain-containing protein n=1 Tax=Verruconis gallopava TaxID=253628 RepID=A0A0D1YEG9_9PEZI|nr:uncharacterized protein PV09_09203 [Verruconis gallopava]KIV99106.1 hypothetical protein PV09_09203 [Verruconis gallopava]